jgi:hypothetical protein
MTVVWNVRDFECLLSEYREALKGSKGLNQARRYKRCILELEQEISKRKAKSKKKLARRDTRIKSEYRA